MDCVVEVYEIAANSEKMLNPIQTIATGCRGLNALETTDDKIFMGFMGSMTQANCIIQTYNYRYEKQ